MGKNKVKVLVVDDSAVMRRLVPKLLESTGEVEVVATAMDGDFALNKIGQFRPDVVTLDIDMPRMNGLTTLEHIIDKYRTPVVMLSSLTQKGASLTMKALELGAVDFICKPSNMGELVDVAEELVAKVKAASLSKVVPLKEGPGKPRPAVVRRALPADPRQSDLLVIGASSGGPNALRYLLPRIPRSFPVGIVIVQHLPESFTSMLARWLDEICELDVRQAEQGDTVLPGRVLIAPGNAHVQIRRRAGVPTVVVDSGPPVNGHKPSVDVLFKSAAREIGARTCALIMTGMGSDGAEGIGDIKRAGGRTVAQDRASCAIFGMPRVAVEKGYIDEVVPLAEMADFLVSTVELKARKAG